MIAQALKSLIAALEELRMSIAQMGESVGRTNIKSALHKPGIYEKVARKIW